MTAPFPHCDLISAMPGNTPYPREWRVEAADIDRMGHVGNIVYLRWVQDIAITHWRSLTTPEEQAAILWVVLRHEIDFLRPAMEGDLIAVTTRVGGASGLSFERYTEIVRSHDGVVLSRAKTLWCPVDPATLRPRRVSSEIRERFSTTGEGM
jgi:acyl-CoA thioester hydrolase